MITQISIIENLHWKLPKKGLIPIAKLTDNQLNIIRSIVKNNREKVSHNFGISNEQWYEDITYLLNYRRVERNRSFLIKKIIKMVK